MGNLLESAIKLGAVQPRRVIRFGWSPVKKIPLMADKDLDLGLGGNLVMGSADVL